MNPDADGNETGKALDWIIERCHEIGVTHDPSKCWEPPDNKRAHHCPIWLETYLLQWFALRIAKIIGWKVLACPFDIYYTELDPVQSEYLIHKAAFIEDKLKEARDKHIEIKNKAELFNLSAKLIEKAAKTYAYVHLACKSKDDFRDACDGRTGS